MATFNPYSIKNIKVEYKYVTDCGEPFTMGTIFNNKEFGCVYNFSLNYESEKDAKRIFRGYMKLLSFKHRMLNLNK